MSAEGIVEKADLFTGKACERITLKIRLFDDSGNMLSNAAYHLVVGDEKYDGTANNGWVEQKIKATQTPSTCWLEWDKDQNGEYRFSLEINLKPEGENGRDLLVSRLENLGYIPDPLLDEESQVIEDFKNRFGLRADVKKEDILKLCDKSIEDLKTGNTLLANLMDPKSSNSKSTVPSGQTSVTV